MPMCSVTGCPVTSANVCVYFARGCRVIIICRTSTQPGRGGGLRAVVAAVVCLITGRLRVVV